MSDSTPTSSLDRTGMMDAIRSRLSVLANRYLSAVARISDACNRRDGILPTDCAPPPWPEPIRMEADTLRTLGADNYTWRDWISAPHWPQHLPVVAAATLRTLNPTETLSLLEEMEEIVECAEGAAEEYVAECRQAERAHYTAHEAALRDLASMLDVRLVATAGPGGDR